VFIRVVEPATSWTTTGLFEPPGHRRRVHLSTAPQRLPADELTRKFCGSADVTASEQVHGGAVWWTSGRLLSVVKDHSQADQLPAVNDWLRCASDSLVKVDPLVQASNYWWAQSDKVDNASGNPTCIGPFDRSIQLTNEFPAPASKVSVSPEPLMQMIQGLQVTAILRAAVQLGIFDQVANGNDRASSIAAAVGADERATRILLDALAALRLLERDNGYRLTPLADTFLVSSRPSYLGGMVNIMAGSWMWTAYPRLPEAVRRGGTILDQHAETPEWEFWETFAPSSTGIAVPAAHVLAELLQEWAGQRDSLEILDIACGSGLYALTLAAQHPMARATLLDWANVLERTKDNVDRLGLHERTSFIEGNAFEVALGGPYDVIIASHIFHHFSERRCLELMRRLTAALKPDGRLVIHEFVTGSRPSDEPFPYLFSIIMLGSSREGEAHSLDTYRRLLSEASLSPPEVHQSQGMPSQFLITVHADTVSD
jgi:C-methyltransferase